MDNNDGAFGEINLLDLPYELLEKVFSYVSYEEMGKLRKTCKLFKDLGSQLLNSSFQRLQSTMLQRFHNIKSQMPRRESARRTHPLARECDIVETVHMRLTLLQMSFGKHIERKHCCFFPGEILDEVHRIFRYIKTAPNLARAYKVTDELFDLTTMAMEYFKEYIEPGLPEITYFATDFLDYNTFSASGGKSCTWKNSCSTESLAGPSTSKAVDKQTSLPPINSVLNRKLKYLRLGMKRNNSRIALLRRKVKLCTSKIGDQQKQLMEQGNRLEEYEKKFEENSHKFSSLLQELNKCKTELQYWRSKSPANQLCGACSKALPTAGSDHFDGPYAIRDAAASDLRLPAEEFPGVASTSTCDFIPIPVGESSVDTSSCGCSEIGVPAVSGGSQACAERPSVQGTKRKIYESSVQGTKRKIYESDTDATDVNLAKARWDLNFVSFQ